MAPPGVFSFISFCFYFFFFSYVFESIESIERYSSNFYLRPECSRRAVGDVTYNVKETLEVYRRPTEYEYHLLHPGVYGPQFNF
jgi:hypothetical protein